LSVATYIESTAPDDALDPDQLRPIEEAPAVLGTSDEERGRRQFVIVDPETATSSANAQVAAPETMACWQRVATLQPTGFGVGQRILIGLARAAALVPGGLGERVHTVIGSYVAPQPAELYQITPECAASG
jgi:hypothetical protein